MVVSASGALPERRCYTPTMADPIAEKKKPKKIGRPRKELDWDEFDKLCLIQCTEQEIAGWFDMSIETLKKRCVEEHGLTFLELYTQKSAEGKTSLRRAQWKSALSGDRTMMIWLGKNHLGQRDAPLEVTGAGGGPVIVRFDKQDEAL